MPQPRLAPRETKREPLRATYPMSTAPLCWWEQFLALNGPVNVAELERLEAEAREIKAEIRRVRDIPPTTEARVEAWRTAYEEKQAEADQRLARLLKKEAWPDMALERYMGRLPVDKPWPVLPPWPDIERALRSIDDTGAIEEGERAETLEGLKARLKEVEARLQELNFTAFVVQDVGGGHIDIRRPIVSHWRELQARVVGKVDPQGYRLNQNPDPRVAEAYETLGIGEVMPSEGSGIKNLPVSR